jgi:hypothetical protein
VQITGVGLIGKVLLLAGVLAVVCCAKVPCERINSYVTTSPKGRWQADVHEDHCGAGFGTDWAGYIVDLRATGGSQPPIDILTPEGDWTRTDRPVARWLSDDKLQITVPNRTTFSMRVAELWGIGIDIRYDNDDPVDRANWIAATKRYSDWIESGGKGVRPAVPPLPSKN